MAKEMVTLTSEEARAFLATRGTVRTGPHRITGLLGHKRHRLPWMYCVQCGVATLKNEATRRHFAKPCVWED